MTQTTHSLNITRSIYWMRRLYIAQTNRDLAVGHEAIKALRDLGFEGHALMALWTNHKLVASTGRYLKKKLVDTIREEVARKSEIVAYENALSEHYRNEYN